MLNSRAQTKWQLHVTYVGITISRSSSSFHQKIKSHENNYIQHAEGFLAVNQPQWRRQQEQLAAQCPCFPEGHRRYEIWPAGIDLRPLRTASSQHLYHSEQEMREARRGA